MAGLQQFKLDTAWPYDILNIRDQGGDVKETMHVKMLRGAIFEVDTEASEPTRWKLVTLRGKDQILFEDGYVVKVYDGNRTLVEVTRTELVPTEVSEETPLTDAAQALKEADALLITSGAGMGVDSGLGTFRGRNSGVWPPLKAMQKDFSEMSCPNWFGSDPRLAWAFWHFRHQAYALGTPHAGYSILAKWGKDLKYGLFSATSNIDGHWARTEGVGPERLYECHGTVMRMQPVHGDGIWATDPAEYAKLNVPSWDLSPGEHVEVQISGGWIAAVVGADGGTTQVSGQSRAVQGVRRAGGPDLMRVSADSELPKCRDGRPARPNVLMFGDWNVDCAIIDEQYDAMKHWLSSIPKDARLVIVEVGAGTAVSTIRRLSESTAQRFPQSALIRVNLEDSKVPSSIRRSIPVGGLGALDALSRIDALLS